MDSKKLMVDAIAKWGVESQLDMVIEECAELIDAIQKFRRGRDTEDEVLEEAVDVGLCLDQLKLILHKEPSDWERVRYDKLVRLQMRLE